MIEEKKFTVTNKMHHIIIIHTFNKNIFLKVNPSTNAALKSHKFLLRFLIYLKLILFLFSGFRRPSMEYQRS